MGSLLRLGRPAVLRALLDVRAAVQGGGEYGYLLNRIWLDDYLVWLQQLAPRWLPKLAEKLEGVVAAMRRESIGWPLEAYEQLALEGEEDEEGDGEDVEMRGAAAGGTRPEEGVVV